MVSQTPNWLMSRQEATVDSLIPHLSCLRQNQSRHSVIVVRQYRDFFLEATYTGRGSNLVGGVMVQFSRDPGMAALNVYVIQYLNCRFLEQDFISSRPFKTKVLKVWFLD